LLAAVAEKLPAQRNGGLLSMDETNVWSQVANLLLQFEQRRRDDLISLGYRSGPDLKSDHSHSLVSKLAEAYNTIPAEQRAVAHPPSSEERVSNPELDKAFERIVRNYQPNTPRQGEAIREQPSDAVDQPVQGCKPHDEARHSRRERVTVLAVVLIVAIALGAGTGLRRYRSTRSEFKSPVEGIQPPGTAPDLLRPAPAASVDASPDKPGSRADFAGTEEAWVRAVDYQVLPGKVIVYIELESMVPYDAHRLQNPERIFMDLHNTRVAQQMAEKVLLVEKAGLKRIRMAQTQREVTRVVLDLEAPANYSITTASNPPRLIVALRP
jgi:hypothetical protein